MGRRKPDGSFSLWGETGTKSIWLTAYVARLLANVKELVPINDMYIQQALKFVKEKQQTDGGFLEDVQNYYYMKTKSQFGVPLTAFVAIAFLENKAYRAENKPVIDKSLSYINSKASMLKDNFAIAIAAYALALNEHESTGAFLSDLIDNAIKQDDKMFWYREIKSFSTTESPSVNVEIAAYAIMALVTAKRAIEALPIMNWLMTQRNAEGGFYSTTDTVVGLQALAMIATVFHSPDVNINIRVSYEKDRQINFQINNGNAMHLQHQELAKDARIINYHAKGNGYAFLQVAFRYNTILDSPSRRFDLSVEPSGNANLLNLKICVNFIQEGDETQSAMTLMEIYLPSGYVYDPQTAELVKNAGVRVKLKNQRFQYNIDFFYYKQRTETQNQKTIIVLYFDSITTSRVCPEVKAIRETVVSELKQSVVKVYDYNNRSKLSSNTIFSCTPLQTLLSTLIRSFGL